MLPKIHLGTLITVTDSHLATHNRERKQAIMEARINRNTEGFYVYQSYLKRLRRMHRAYVTRFKQQNKMTTFGSPVSQSPHVFDVRGNYIQTRNFNDNILVHNHNNNGHNFPLSKHRVSLSGHVAAPNTPVESLAASLQSPSLSSGISTDGDGVSKRAVTFAQEKDAGSTRSSFSIHIPCGREASFELSSSNDQTRDGGALPFRMWKQRRDQTGLPSVYSQNNSTTASEEHGPKSRVVVLDKTVPRTVLISKQLFVSQKK